MSERLYYKDSTQLDFEAQVTASGQHEGLHYVVLDRTAFYPTSGGQPYDTGSLGGVEVCSVIESDDGGIWHLSEQEIAPVGQSVIGLVDKERRFRNCRNHTGQHILSAAAYKLFGLETMSVHLGDEYGAIEFNTKSLSSDKVRELESMANDVIADNAEIEIIFADASRIAALPLRKPPQRDGELRIMRIGQFDYVACGGTHCATSGGVGLVKIFGTEKIRGRVMIKYLAGKLAVADYVERFIVTDRLAKDFTCHASDLINKIDKLSSEQRDLRAGMVELQKQMLPSMAESLVKKTMTAGEQKYIVEPAGDLDPQMAARLASLAAEEIGGLVVLGVDSRLLLAAADGSGIHAGELARAMTESFALKGGGNERNAQLGGADLTDLAAYRAEIGRLLSCE